MMPPGDGPPPEPPTPTPPPPPQGPTWEDRAGVLAASAVFLGSLLPWWDGQPAFHPNAEAAATGAFGLLTLGVLIFGQRRIDERTRRGLSLVLGLILTGLLAYVAVLYYRFHAGLSPKLGIIGHLTYLGPGLDLALLGAILLAWSGIPTKRPAPPATHDAGPIDRRLRWHTRWGLPLLIFVASFTYFQTQVEEPSIVDFDEAHYVQVAVNMTDRAWVAPGWGEPRPFNFEHPPVGKYLIALGYALYGEPHDELDWSSYHNLCKSDNPECARDAASWRFGSVLVGSLGVVGLYWLGLRLFQSVTIGAFAALFLLLDNFWYLHSRIALLDIFPAGLALLAFGVFLGPGRAHPWVGGALFGLAAASKHTALFLAPAFLLLAFLRSPQTDRWMRLRDALLKGLLVPVAVYVLAYAPYLWIWVRHDGFRYAAEFFVHVHQEGFRWTYRADPEKPHAYISDPWTWIVMRRPVFYFVGYDTAGRVGHIYAIGNPLLWWSACSAIVYTWITRGYGWAALRPRLGLRAFWEWTGRPFAFTRDQALLFSTLLFATAYGPFFLLQRDPFNFYFVIAAPFFSLVLAGYVGWLATRGPGSRLVAVLILLAIAAVYVFYRPVVAGTYIEESDFQYIMHRVPGMRQ